MRFERAVETLPGGPAQLKDTGGVFPAAVDASNSPIGFCIRHIKESQVFRRGGGGGGRLGWGEG